ncbi:MAG: response regulator transcription factor, partial [Actinomycetota bacterium]
MIKVLLADDQGLVRAGFRALLEPEEDIEVVGEATDGSQ